MEYKITKIDLLKRINNDMQRCNYYKVHFRLYIDKKRFYRWHFIMQIDSMDVMEMQDKDIITPNDWNICKYESAYGFLDSFRDKNDLLKACNETIDNWNGTVRANLR